GSWSSRLDDADRGPPFGGTTSPCSLRLRKWHRECWLRPRLLPTSAAKAAVSARHPDKGAVLARSRCARRRGSRRLARLVRTGRQISTPRASSQMSNRRAKVIADSCTDQPASTTPTRICLDDYPRA